MMRETKVVLKSIEMEMLIFLIISAVVPKLSLNAAKGLPKGLVQ